MQFRIRVGVMLAASFAAVTAVRAQAPETKPTAAASKAVSTKSSPQTQLERSIPELMHKGTVPGLQIALIANGQTSWLGDFGVKDASTGNAVTNETVFEAASLSKTVFAYGVLKLVDQGKLNLDDPLSGYLPSPYLEGDDRLNKITARIVLSHRTGFPNWRQDGNALTIRFTPGERFSYSGEGFVYLAKVIEQITGKPLNEYLTEAVFVPLGMKESSYVWRNDYDESMASGHDSDGHAVGVRKSTEANAASSLHTTARDYALFVEAILRGTGLKPATLQQMESPQIAVDPTCTNCTEHPPAELSKTIFWGLGWGIARTNQGDALWHWGDNGVFKCFVAAYPKQKNGVVLFTNSENGLAIAEDIVHQSLGTELPVFTWLKYERFDSPGMRFAAAVREKGAAAGIAEFGKELQAGTITENSLNSTGYRLMGQKKSTDAIEIFKLNVRLHPDSWNAYDSLGEAYMDQGDKPLAIQNYEKSLQLNPKNGGAAVALKKLQGK
jgi:CubicO group peptidase (beta-lactamase class C family)